MRTVALFTLVTIAAVIPALALAQTQDQEKPPSPPPEAPSVPAPPPLVVTPAEASAPHQGFYLRLWSGLGFMSFFGDGPLGSASISGLAEPTDGVAVGGSPVRGFAIAATLWGSGVTNTFNGGPFDGAIVASPRGTIAAMHGASTKASAGLGGIGVLVDWYPQPAGDWHAGASVGLGVTAVTTLADDAAMGGFGFGACVFGGYDWWIGRSWSLGSMLVASGANRISLNDSNRNDTGYRLMPLSIGIAATLLYY
jgi:hypothetical protein